MLVSGENRRIIHTLPRLPVHRHRCLHLKLCLLLLLSWAQGEQSFFGHFYYSSFAAEVNWVFWATVSSERPAFCLLCWYCRISVLFFQIYLRYKTRYYFSKNSRNMSALIFPRLHQRPAHEPTVGGQPTPQNGRSGPSGAQVVNHQPSCTLKDIS